jgi:predicted ATPase
MAEPLVRLVQLLPPADGEERAGYPWELPAVARLADGLELHPNVTYLVGENGSGKSTLLEAIAVAAGMNPEGGSSNFNFSTRASHSGLGQTLRLVRGGRRPRTDFFLRAESLFTAATYLEELSPSALASQ